MYRCGANEKEKALQSFELQGLIWYFRTQSRCCTQITKHIQKNLSER